MNKKILFITIIYFIVSIVESRDSTQNVKIQYKSNQTYDCSELSGEVTFFQSKVENNTEVKNKLESVDPYHISNKQLTISSLKKEQIMSTFFCKDERDTKTFIHQIKPYTYKQEKTSNTVTEGGSIEMTCKLLYGAENNEIVTWKWFRNNSEIKSDSERFTVTNEAGANQTKLVIKNVEDSDKGTYECLVSNRFGEYEDKIILRVKDKLAALWPFLAIVAEVIILCTIILIYEKKCAKKHNSNDEETDQTQNLMGNKDTQNIDLKKRTAKA